MPATPSMIMDYDHDIVVFIKKEGDKVVATVVIRHRETNAPFDSELITLQLDDPHCDLDECDDCTKFFSVYAMRAMIPIDRDNRQLGYRETNIDLLISAYYDGDRFITAHAEIQIDDETDMDMSENCYAVENREYDD